MVNIPLTIINLAVEATSEHNDGLTKEAARKNLEAIQVYISELLKDMGQGG